MQRIGLEGAHHAVAAAIAPDAALCEVESDERGVFLAGREDFVAHLNDVPGAFQLGGRQDFACSAAGSQHQGHRGNTHSVKKRFFHSIHFFVCRFDGKSIDKITSFVC